jgi:hypothetical protein
MSAADSLEGDRTNTLTLYRAVGAAAAIAREISAQMAS